MLIVKDEVIRANEYQVYDSVRLGSEAHLGSYVVLGEPEQAGQLGDLGDTVIGDNATIRSHTVIYAGNHIGNNFQTGHGVLIRDSNQIGDNVSVGSHTVIEHHVVIGKDVRIHSNAFIPEYSVLEDGCWIGPNAVLTNVPHPLCSEAKKCLRGPRIRRGAKIGANVTILPAVTVGRNALIGAGSVVVRDVPDNAVVAGNPARVVKSVNDLECRYGLVDSPYGEIAE